MKKKIFDIGVSCEFGEYCSNYATGIYFSKNKDKLLFCCKEHTDVLCELIKPDLIVISGKNILNLNKVFDKNG